MKQRVIKLNERDVERLVNKILTETKINEVGFEDKFKKGQLKPAKAIVRGVEKLVIVDHNDIVQAVGPDMEYLKGADKKEICRIADILITNLFDLDEAPTDQLIDEVQGYDDITPINFCSKS
jgi:hypothetical protein